MNGQSKASAAVVRASGGIGRAFESALAFDIVHGFARSQVGTLHLDLLDETGLSDLRAGFPMPAICS
jgi:hypothetical protein